MNPSTNNATGRSERSKRLPAWRVVLSMIRFRPWLWLGDLAARFGEQLCWGIAAGLVMRAFFDLLTGEAPVRLGIWSKSNPLKDLPGSSLDKKRCAPQGTSSVHRVAARAGLRTCKQECTTTGENRKTGRCAPRCAITVEEIRRLGEVLRGTAAQLLGVWLCIRYRGILLAGVVV